MNVADWMEQTLDTLEAERAHLLGMVEFCKNRKLHKEWIGWKHALIKVENKLAALGNKGARI